jgi:hypothetical protein
MPGEPESASDKAADIREAVGSQLPVYQVGVRKRSVCVTEKFSENFDIIGSGFSHTVVPRRQPCAVETTTANNIMCKEQFRAHACAAVEARWMNCLLAFPFVLRLRLLAGRV